MKYKHIIWDWNGTLLNDCWLCVEIMNLLLEPRGLEQMTEERYRRVFDFPVYDYYVNLGFDFEKERFEAVAMEFMNIYKKRQIECSLHDHSKQILADCRKLNLSQSVLSAMEQELLDQMIEHNQLRDFFEQLVGLSDHFAEGKTENGKLHIEEIGLEPKEVILVGDTLHDFEVAQEMGTDILLVSNGHHSEKRLATTSAPILKSLAEVPHYLSGS